MKNIYTHTCCFFIYSLVCLHTCIISRCYARNLIPFKGQVLNMISEWAFSQTKEGGGHSLLGLDVCELQSI